MHQLRRGAFSLIEILIVVAIIAILAAIVVPRLTGGKEPMTGKKGASPIGRARQTAGISYIAQIKQAIEMYKMDNDGQLPPNLQALTRYGVTPDMLLDPNTRQPVAYNPQTGEVGN
jgi:general secretion pathway protein G